MESVETSAGVNEPSHPSTFRSKSPNAEFTPHDDFDVTIIWHNMYAPSNFITVRKESRGLIERILVDFAKVLESGIFEEVYSVSASKYLFCVAVVCMKNNDEGVMEQIGRVE